VAQIVGENSPVHLSSKKQQFSRVHGCSIGVVREPHTLQNRKTARHQQCSTQESEKKMLEDDPDYALLLAWNPNIKSKWDRF
jgi:hypothetical protein